MAKYTADHPPLIDKPGENWVSKAGGLPKPIDAIARALVAKGFGTSRAVATAVNSVKRTCATGKAFGGKTTVSPEARAVACKAVAAWEALKARSHSMAAPADRRAVELAFKRIEGDALRIDMAGGLVPATVTVKNAKGTTFQRKIMVRPSQAKAMKGKSQTVTKQGLAVTKETTAVLNELAKIPKGQRPKGWQDLVKTLADPRHSGRLGPQKRRLLHSVASGLPAGHPLRAAAAAALKADAKPPVKGGGRKVRGSKPRAIVPVK